MRRVSLLKVRRIESQLVESQKSESQLVESQKKEELDEGKLEVSELGVIQLEEGEPYDDDQDGGQDEVDADDVPCRLADS